MPPKAQMMTPAKRAGHRRSEAFLRVIHKHNRFQHIFSLSASPETQLRMPFPSVSCLFVLIALLAAGAYSQELPREIRGYKIHRANILLKTSLNIAKDDKMSEASVRLGDPDLTDVGLTGLAFEISAEIDPLEQSGRVDFLLFHDFRINGLTVDIEEYRELFSFRKNQPVALPKPAKVFIGTGSALRAGWRELVEKKDEWTVTGRIFVFGRFRKMGFDFKRVIPVDVNLRIKNPLLHESE